MGGIYVTSGFKTKTVLIFPQKPHPNTVVYKICHLNGYRITRNVNKKADFIINWENCTFRRSYKILDALGRLKPVLNIKCKDISFQKKSR